MKIKRRKRQERSKTGCEPGPWSPEVNHNPPQTILTLPCQRYLFLCSLLGGLGDLTSTTLVGLDHGFDDTITAVSKTDHLERRVPKLTQQQRSVSYHGQRIDQEVGSQ